MFKIHKPNHLTNLKYTASVIDVTMFAVKLSYKASVKKKTCFSGSFTKGIARTFRLIHFSNTFKL